MALQSTSQEAAAASVEGGLTTAQPPPVVGLLFYLSVLQRPDLLRTAYSNCHPSWSHQQQRRPAQSLHPTKDAGCCLGEHGALFTLRFQLLATAVQSHPWRARVYKHLMSLSPHLIQAYWDTLSAP